MPTDNKSIGSQGLEQGGANLGNEYSRPGTHIEQNETTNIGSNGKIKYEKDKKHNTADGYSDEDEELLKEAGDE